jgi:hypothetical protein
VVRDIGDTTVQLSWSRGFDNHSPIAKYTLQARTPPSGKWKQVRTSKYEAPCGSVLITTVCTAEDRGQRVKADPKALKRIKVCSLTSRENLGRQGNLHSQEGKERESWRQQPCVARERRHAQHPWREEQRPCGIRAH